MKFQLKRQSSLYVATLLLANFGCSVETDAPAEDRTVDVVDDMTATGGAMTASGGTTSGSGGTDTSGTGGTTDEPDTLEVEAFLPMNITDYFGPSGFMGREGTKKEIDGIVMDVEGCPTRAENASGECFSVDYSPQELAEDGATWAGVFFQNPEMNWGEERGVVVEPGASKIVFTAWADAEGQEVEFIAGGIGNLGTLYADTFKVGKKFTLTTTPTQYELDMSSSQYENVLGGFGWVIAADSLDPIVFYIDDMQWVK